MELLTVQDVLNRPELYGMADGFSGSIETWISIETRAIERYIGVCFVDLTNEGKQDFNNVLVKLVYWNWCWPENVKIRTELLDSVSHLESVPEESEDFW